MHSRLIHAVQSALLIALPPVGQVALAEGQTAVLEEIVVTARKREERLIDVPMAVSSFSGEQLEATGVESIKELYGTAPNVYFVAAEFGSDTIGQHLVVRGIGATPIIEPGVGTFVDGVYQPNMGFDMDFLEVERVEILRGPQGTLFGRNTQGGALNIVTRKPGEAFEGKARVRTDEFDTVDLQGYVAGPVGERLAMSLALRYEESDGFLDNIELGRPQTAFDQLVSQFRVVANPTDTLTLDLSVDVKRWRGGMLGAGVPDSGIDDYLTYNSDLDDSRDDIVGLSFRLDWDLPWATFTSITGNREAETLQFSDIDGREFEGNYQHIRVEQATLSQEFRLASNAAESPWDWTLGAFWFDEFRNLDQDIFAGAQDPSFGILAGLTADQWYDISREGYALFGQATYSVGRWDFTAGTRYSEEKPEIDSRVNFTVPFFAVIGLPPTTDFLEGNSTKIDAVTSMGSASYAFSDGVKGYVTVAQGFKAGGFQDFQGAPGPEYEPFDNEELISYEVGLKSQLFDNRLNVNLAAFYMDITQQQIRVRVFQPFPVNRVFNIGESSSKGFEAELVAVPAEGLVLSLSYSYTEAEFDSIDIPPDSDPSGDINFLTGTPFPFVPEQTAAASIQYTQPVTNDWDLTVYGGVRYVDSYITGLNTVADPLGNTRIELPEVDDYTLTTLRFTLESDRWRASLYAENLFDETIVLVQQLGSFYTNEPFSVLAPPRTIGGTLTYRW